MTPLHVFALNNLFCDDSFDAIVYKNEPMQKHTTYRIGGCADYYVQVESIGALKLLIDICNQSNVDWFVVGKGSNLLVSDDGYEGVIINLGRDFRAFNYNKEEGYFAVGAGVPLSSVVQKAFSNSVEGFEFAVGTPGSVGGALKMNAGSADVWIGNLVRSVTYLRDGIDLVKVDGSKVVWSYRSSSFSSNDVILECELEAKTGDPMTIKAKMEASGTRRRKTQPLAALSCGSVFKNPCGKTAGALIDGLGLKGLRIGGACVSDVHANFIVNDKNATASDVYQLIKLVQSKVFEAYGIKLMPEVCLLGFN